jgi:predicted ATPase/class 3 adenylate cyclase
MAFSSDPSLRTLTFLFTDLVGSTRLWEQYPDGMKAVMERHDALLRAAVESSAGQVVKMTGDGLHAVFASTVNAVSASLQAQRSLQAEDWGESGPPRVRMGLHVGEAQPRAGDYYGPAVNRAARLMSAAHGGQVLLSSAAVSLVGESLPEAAALRDLGEHRLKDLARPERVFQLLHPDLPADFPPLVTLDNRPNNLPAQSTTLIGRETELAEIVKRLHPSTELRLLTLIGPGGIGKTRLALQAAADLVDEYADGVYFVDLAPIRDPEAVFAAIAQAVNLKQTGERPLPDELREHLRARETLLLLDNFEQVTAAASHVVDLLRSCPQLKVLVTSREGLHVRGEHLFPVPPLGLPSADLKQPSIDQLTQYEAVRLFIERAQAVKPDFSVTNENAPAVAEICWRLDGLPLAIELVTARLNLFSPQELLRRLGSRMTLLRGGALDLPARQQTLRDTIGWSYELLEPGEQRLFELLSVFPSSTIEALEGVAAGIDRLDDRDVDLLDGLASLVDKSLVRRVDHESGESLFVMLETIREYAAERLDEDPAFSASARRAHAAYFAGFTQRQWDRLTGREREASLAALELNLENLRISWRYWAAEKDLEQLGKLTDSLWMLNDARGWYHATIDLTTDLLNILASIPSTPERVEQELLLRTSLARALLVTKGFTPEVEQAFNRALELCEGAGEIPQLFPVLRGLAYYYTMRGDIVKGVQMGEQILRLAERYDDAGMRVEGHLVIGQNLGFLENLPAGIEQLEKALEYFDPGRPPSVRFRLGTSPGVVCYSASAMLLWLHGFPDRARDRTNQAVALARQLDHSYSLAYALFHKGMLHLWRGEADVAQKCAEAVLKIAEEHDFKVWSAVGTCLDALALAGSGLIEQGLEQLDVGMQAYQGLKTPPVFWPMLLVMRARLNGQAGKPDQGLAWLAQALQFPAPGAEASVLPEAYLLKGDLLLAVSPDNLAEAEALFRQVLETAAKFQAGIVELQAACRLCRLWMEQGKGEPGKQLLREVYEKFTEGFITADLVIARALLGIE